MVRDQGTFIYEEPLNVAPASWATGDRMADAQHHLIVREGISVAIALLILVFVPLVLLAYRHAIWRAMSSFLSSHDGGKLNIPQWLRHDLRRTAVIAIGVFIGLAAWSWWR